MRDWLSHRILVELFERRQRGTISKAGCKRVRTAVMRGTLVDALNYLEQAAEADDPPIEEWFEPTVRDAVADWEREGLLSESDAETVRRHLDAGDWAGAVETVWSAASR